MKNTCLLLVIVIGCFNSYAGNTSSSGDGSGGGSSSNNDQTCHAWNKDAQVTTRHVSHCETQEGKTVCFDGTQTTIKCSGQSEQKDTSGSQDKK